MASSWLRNRRWIPIAIMGIGVVLMMGAGRQQSYSLEAPLGSVVPMDIAGFQGQDDWISDAEADAAGFSNYLFRLYYPATAEGTEARLEPEPPQEAETRDVEETESRGPEESTVQIPGFSLYVGFYESQAEGKTIHSPKNCLPGAGWEALSSDPIELTIGDRVETVNRYVIQNGSERSLAMYWYQGRGRVAYDEYRVKWNLLVDAAFRSRSDEALVRIIVPMPPGMEDQAEALAVSVAEQVLPNLERALPN